jgi:hypothetical protein
MITKIITSGISTDAAVITTRTERGFRMVTAGRARRDT